MNKWSFIFCVGLYFPLIVLTSCSESNEEEDKNPAVAIEENGPKGMVQLSMVSSSTSEAPYRLRDGVFRITRVISGESIEVSTETDPDIESIDLTLPVGLYSIYLNSGFHLERVSDEFKYDLDGGVRDIEATLISENPMMVSVAANSVAKATFVFRVGNGMVSIGIDVVEEVASCTDDYEPNDEDSSPSPIVPDVAFTATACSDEDYYSFDSPVPAGEPFIIDVLFSNEISDIDAVLINSNKEQVSVAESISDNEQLWTISNGEPYLLHVYSIDSELPNKYEVSFNLDESLSDGCTVSALPGCVDQEIQECVCAADSHCCVSAFDEWCVEFAQAECRLNCGLLRPESNCCEEGKNPGCTDEVVATCVCDIDPTCCEAFFDNTCVELATNMCGASC